MDIFTERIKHGAVKTGEKLGLLERQVILTVDEDVDKRFAKEYRGIEAVQEGQAEVAMTDYAEQAFEHAQRVA